MPIHDLLVNNDSGGYFLSVAVNNNSLNKLITSLNPNHCQNESVYDSYLINDFENFMLVLQMNWSELIFAWIYFVIRNVTSPINLKNRKSSCSK